MKSLRIACGVLLMGGACLVGRAAYLHAKAELAGILIAHAWKKNVEAGKPQRPWPWADTYPIARLRIPRLGYDEYVLEDASARNLAFGPARLLSGAAVGEGGNLVIAGHRTSWFRPLEGIKTGDSIQLEWPDAGSHALLRRTYKVAGFRVVEPNDVSLLAPTASDTLTLITCYPFGHSPYSPQRFVVHAIPEQTVSTPIAVAAMAVKTQP